MANHGVIEVLSGGAVAICVVRHGGCSWQRSGGQIPTTQTQRSYFSNHDVEVQIV